MWWATDHYCKQTEVSKVKNAKFFVIVDLAFDYRGHTVDCRFRLLGQVKILYGGDWYLEFPFELKISNKLTMSANYNDLFNRRQQRLDELETQRRDLEAKRRYEVWLKDRNMLDAELKRWQVEEKRCATLHYNFMCNKQLVGGARWHTIRRLREKEIKYNVTGLVLEEEEWMRVLDTRLAAQGAFIGSYTKKYLVDPVLGVIPQLPPEL